MIDISVERFLKLLNAERILNALYDGGVDNWEWYEDSLPDGEINFGDLRPGIVVEP